MRPIKNLLLLSAKQRRLCEQLEQNRARLSRMVYAWSHDEDMPAEVAHETMVNALNNIDQVRSIGNLDRWLFKQLSCCFIERLNRQRDNKQKDDAAESELSQDDMFASVRHTVACLPLKSRQVVTLIDIENFSYADVAEILDVPPGSVMHHVDRARKILKQSFDSPRDLHGNRLNSSRARLKVVK